MTCRRGIAISITQRNMQNNPNDTLNTMTVDIRLCGNIPRNEMKVCFGAPYPTTALTSQVPHLSTSCLAETNGCPTLRKTALCDQALLSGLIIQNSDNMKRGVLTEKQQPLSPVLEPPSWAVPARWEARLEVSFCFFLIRWLIFTFDLHS